MGKRRRRRKQWPYRLLNPGMSKQRLPNTASWMMNPRRKPIELVAGAEGGAVEVGGGADAVGDVGAGVAASAGAEAPAETSSQPVPRHVAGPSTGKSTDSGGGSASGSRLANVEEVRKQLGLTPAYDNLPAIENIRVAVLDYGFEGVNGPRHYLPE